MNISIYKQIALMFALAFISFSAISSSTMRCGNKIVMVGDTTTDVKIICGKPFDSESTGLTQKMMQL